jgi:hypothetical protein
MFNSFVGFVSAVMRIGWDDFVKLFSPLRGVFCKRSLCRDPISLRRSEAPCTAWHGYSLLTVVDTLVRSLGLLVRERRSLQRKGEQLAQRLNRLVRIWAACSTG